MLEVPHRGRRQQLPEEQDHQPAGPLAHHLVQRDAHVRLVERFRAAELLDVFGRGLFDDVEHIVHRDDPHQLAGRIHHRQRRAVVPAKRLDRLLFRVGDLQRVELLVAQAVHRRLQRPQQKFPDAHVIDQLAVLVHDVQHVQRLAVSAVLPDVIEHLLHRPRIPDRDEIRRHQPPDAALAIPEQRLGGRALCRRQQIQQLRNRRARQLLQQRRAIVGRHLVEDLDRVLLPQRAQQTRLRVHVEILEHVGGHRLRQDAENHHLLLDGKPDDALRQIGRMPFGENLL